MRSSRKESSSLKSTQISRKGVAVVSAVVIALAAIAMAVSFPGKPGKLYPTFVAAGEHFRNGEPIYGAVPEGQDQYRYSPLAQQNR